MAIIKVLKDEQLVGGQDNTKVYPVTHTKAVYDENNNQLEVRLTEIENDTKELHKQTEKLSLAWGSHTPADGIVIEIPNTAWIDIVANASIETFGDAPNEKVTYTGTIKIDDSTLITKTTNTPISENVQADRIPSAIGQHTIKFIASYNGVEKTISRSFYRNLKKYFGFYASQPASPEILSVNHISNNANCTVTILPNGTGFKYIYFSVPENMTINKIIQPDALNAPLSFTQLGNIIRRIEGKEYTYKLYRSTEQLDSSVSKRLTIS